MLRFPIPSKRKTSIDGVSNFLLQTNIIVSEFTHLGVIDTENFGLLRSSEAEARNEVHDPEDPSLQK